MSAVDLAKVLECSPTNIYNKLKRDNFSEKELKQIADILNCDFKGSFIPESVNPASHFQIQS